MGSFTTTHIILHAFTICSSYCTIYVLLFIYLRIYSHLQAFDTDDELVFCMKMRVNKKDSTTGWIKQLSTSILKKLKVTSFIAWTLNAYNIFVISPLL